MSVVDGTVPNHGPTRGAGTTSRIAALGTAALLTALLAACAASTPAPVLLTLPSMSGTVEPATATAALAPPAAGTAPLLAVRRIEIPEYLSARRVRYRADPSTLAEWPNTYWGERIEIGVSREFGAALRRALPGWSFCELNCAEQTPTLGLRVEIAPLDYLRAERRLEARARLHVVAGDLQARPLRSREVEYRIEAAGDTPQSEAEAIATLIRRIAGDAAQLVGSTPPR